MSRRARLMLFGVSAVVTGVLLGWGVSGLQAFGDFNGEYGQILNGVAGRERHVTNVVAAVVFDYRGFDTLGEDFILFSAVLGVALLLREARDDLKRNHLRLRAARAVACAATGPRRKSKAASKSALSPGCVHPRPTSTAAATKNGGTDEAAIA